MVDNPTQDSITMAQLKQFVSTLPSKQKLESVQFQYADMDTVTAEIDEFYGYSEVHQFVENEDHFTQHYDGDWQKSSHSEREAYAEYLLDFLDQKKDSSRLSVTHQLVYIAQGAYAGVVDEDDHLSWIIKNNRMLRKLGAFQTYYDALRIACSKYVLSIFAHSFRSTAIVLSEPSVSVEIEALLTLLYMLVVSHEDDESFMDDLAATNPSITVFLYDQICLRPSKDHFYPLKKMLLLLWKVLRTTLGGTDDLPILKDIARRLVGGQPLVGPNAQKSDPIDYMAYQAEMSQKYPTYIPPAAVITPECPVPISTIASVLQAATPGSGTQASKGSTFSSASSKHGKGSSGIAGFNNTQPFIFPSANMHTSTPKSITEAEELFKKNMYISTATLQIFQEKKRMTDRGYRSLRDADDQDSGRALEYRQPVPVRNKAYNRRKRLSRRGNDNGNQGDDEADDRSDGDDDFASDSEGDWKESQSRRQSMAGAGSQTVSDKEREAIDKIKHIYTEIVPRMAQIQVTLLKTLLVCIKVSGATAAKESSNAEAEGKEPIDSFTKVNDIREHEIMSKAVSSILLLQLQHFKIYHVLAFNYVCQLLVDSNCLLLLLKIFGNAENPGNIHTKNEIEEYNFFKTCHIIRSTRKDNPADPEHARSGILRAAIADLGDPLPPNYVCRWNMFTIIHLLRVLQKLTKRKTHRILLLVQYKSSAILKRLLKINHPDLLKYVYKALKSQVPFLGRKWRSSHMKVITGIYLYCKTSLRDDWISGADVERDLEDALPAEQQLRNLIRYYHDRVHPHALVPDPAAQSKTAATNGNGANANGAGANQQQHQAGPRYDWQEIYEAHSSVSEVNSVLGHRSSQFKDVKSDGEDSTKSMASHNSSSSNGGSGLDTFGDSAFERRRDMTLNDIVLDPSFMENYSHWLEAEVFGKQAPLLSDQKFTYSDFYYDSQPELPFLRPIGDGSGWDTPAVMPSDEEDIAGFRPSVFNFSRWEDEELYKQINWTPNRWGDDATASVEEQYYLDGVSQYDTFDEDNMNTYRADDSGQYQADPDDKYGDYRHEEEGERAAEVDADTGVDLITSQGNEGGSLDGGTTGSGEGPGSRRRPRPLRVRKSDMGTEWIDENDKEEVIHAYGPPPSPHIIEGVDGVQQQDPVEAQRPRDPVEQLRELFALQRGQLLELQAQIDRQQATLDEQERILNKLSRC
ncbi:Factor arrest protein 11 [Podila epigama]|nr:Factor arrest protein 11 [Podila epigama]